MTAPRFSPATLDALARVNLPDLERVIRDINWSLGFDCLRYETFTPHAKAVLSRAADDLAALNAALDADWERAMRAADETSRADQRVPQPHRFGGVL